MGRCLRSRGIGVLAVQVDSISHKNYQFRKNGPMEAAGCRRIYQEPDCISCMPVQLKNNYCIVIIVSVAREKIWKCAFLYESHWSSPQVNPAIPSWLRSDCLERCKSQSACRNPRFLENPKSDCLQIPRSPWSGCFRPSAGIVQLLTIAISAIISSVVL